MDAIGFAPCQRCKIYFKSFVWTSQGKAPCFITGKKNISTAIGIYLNVYKKNTFA